MKLPLLVAGFLLRREDTSSPKAIDVDLVAPRSAKADLYLSPIEIAGHSFRTCPSNRHAASWVPLANACEVIGKNSNRWNKGLVDACTDSQLLSETKLGLPSGNSSVVHIVDNEGNYDADIVPGVAPSIKVGGSVVENFGMGFAKATNASFGIMGLGRDSGLLDRLKKEGNIGAKAFSLWIGSDFKEFQDWDGHPQHESYPGSLVLGGYDFAKQKGDDYIRGSLVGGMPRIQLTGISMNGSETAQLLGTTDDALDVEIDSSVPRIYLPPALATKIKNAMEDPVQNKGTLASEGKLDNFTMTIRLPKPGDSADMRQLNITFPESIWHEGSESIGNPKQFFQAFTPIVNRTGPTAIFGRAFLKAVYLAVNYETDEFQIAPASFSSEKNIHAFTSPANGAKSWPTNESKTSDSDGSDGINSPLLIGGVVGGGVLIAIVLGFIFRWVRKKKGQTKHAQNFGYSHQSCDSPPSSEYPKAEATTTESSESYSKLDLPTGTDVGDHSHETLLIPPEFYEYGGYIHSKRLSTKLDTTTLTYPTTYTPHKENHTTVPKAEACEPTERVVTPPPDIPHKPADCSPSPPKATPVPTSNEAAPSPVAPFSSYSPSAVDNLWKKLPQPPHMHVHEMPC